MAYDAPQAYTDAMRAASRQVDIVISTGYNLDQGAADDIDGITADMLPMSNPLQVVDAVYELDGSLATFEGYGIPTSGRMTVPPLSASSYPPEAGVWSEDISDGDGYISWTYTMSFSAVHRSAITVYTREMQILAASIVFRSGGSVTESGDMTVGSGYVAYGDAAEYDEVSITVTRIQEPYCHVKITEVEFGTSRAFSRNALTGAVSIIQEEDPLMLSIPLHELDFALFNDGRYDPDNPRGEFDSLDIGYSVQVGVSCTDAQGARHTIPIGSYVIHDKEVSGSSFRITCYDPRIYMQETYMAWTLHASQSFAVQIGTLLTDLHISHIIDSALESMYPDADHDFENSVSLLQHFLWIQQYYGIYLVPRRDGYFHVEASKPEDAYGDVPVSMMKEWPAPARMTTYNYISVGYYDSGTLRYYDIDLRRDSRQVSMPITITNPMITTSAKAQELAETIQSLFYTQMVQMEWWSDAATDVGDTVGLSGKWSEEAEDYRLIRQDMTYDGGLTSIIKGIR